jgi:hypothetical protein
MVTSKPFKKAAPMPWESNMTASFEWGIWHHGRRRLENYVWLREQISAFLLILSSNDPYLSLDRDFVYICRVVNLTPLLQNDWHLRFYATNRP